MRRRLLRKASKVPALSNYHLSESMSDRRPDMTDHVRAVPHMEIIILAAGLGQRFESSGGHGHKALAPLWDRQGTLHLLLSRLGACCNLETVPVTIVTGRWASQVQAVLDSHHVSVLHNPDHAHESLLQSLARSVKRTRADFVIVLFADTLYSLKALQNILQTVHRAKSGSAACALVAVSPVCATPESGVQPQIRANLAEDDFVLQFDAPSSAWQMAHAVVWPRRLVPCLVQAAQSAGVSHQWQVLQKVLDESNYPEVRAIRLSQWSTFDIDTISDLKALRHDHRVRASHVAYFANHVSKERTFDTERDALSGNVYRKYCESKEAAQHEFDVMCRLHGLHSDLFMSPIDVEGRCLRLGFAAGIRLYDLLVRAAHHSRGPAIRAILLERCLQRLHATQAVLLSEAGHVAAQPYPFKQKVIGLLHTLCDLLAVPFSQKIKVELDTMHGAWDLHCQIPFRDATPKNIMIGIPSLMPLVPAAQRARELTIVLEREDAFWKAVPIIDIDFTSTRDLTVPEDDVISLLAHNSTFDAMRVSRTALPLLPGVQHSAERADLAWFVRYLRFGGRKMLYKLLNPGGFAVRFRFDEPCFYFEQLPHVLSSDFYRRYPATIELLSNLRNRAELYRGYTPSDWAHDHFLESLHPRYPDLAVQDRYWQESPLEWRAENV